MTVNIVGVPAGSASNWRYETTVPAVGTVTRTTNTAAVTWSGQIVAGGKVKVNAVVPATAAGVPAQTYPLEVVVGITPRSGWSFPAAPASKRPNGYKVPLCGVTLNANAAGTAGDGKYYACIKWDLVQADIGQLTDNGPNHGLKWVLDIRDRTTADWVMHPDVEDPKSAWYTHQCGNWIPNPGSTCASPSGSGFISATNYRDGVARHEAGSQNSHHSQYVAAQNDVNNNIKVGAEAEVGSVSVSKANLLLGINARLQQRANGIAAGSQVEPCHHLCSSDCSTYNGYANLPPFVPCPANGVTRAVRAWRQ